MPNLDLEMPKEESIAGKSIPREQPPTLLSRLQLLLLSQRRNLQSLSLLTLFNFLAAGIFFVTQVKIANVIGKDNFGHLAYAIAMGMYGQAIVRYGMDRTLVRDLIHYPNRFAELVAGSLVLRGGIQVLLIAGILIWKYSFDASGTLSWGVIAVVIAYSLQSLDLQPVYDAWMRMGRHAAYNLLQRTLYFLFVWSIIFWSPGNLSVGSVGFVLLGTQVFYLLLQQRWAFRRIDLGTINAPLANVLAELSRSNFWIWLASIAALSLGSLNQIILGHYCGAAELGGYAASWQIAAAVMLLFTQIARFGNPATARKTSLNVKGDVRKLFLLRYACLMFLIASPFTFILVLFPEQILHAFFKKEFSSATDILRIQGIYLLIIALGLVSTQYVISAKMQKTFFLNIVFGGIISAFFCFVLIPKFAGLGAALALLIAQGCTMILFWISTIQHVRRTKMLE